ncbi:putative glutathione S-transferase Omega/GSH, Thioredoxin-like superfamily [Helianthus anomalus]
MSVFMNFALIPTNEYYCLLIVQRTLKMARSALDEMSESGAFIRSPSTFRSLISRDPNSTFSAEPGRYHLYVSYACPWASRCLAYLKIKGLDKAIDFTVSLQF